MPNAGDIIRASDVAVQECRVTRNSALSVAHSLTTYTVVPFDAEITDNDGMHDTVTNNSRITFQREGLYTIGFAGSFATAADYSRTACLIRLNGTIELVRSPNATGTAASQIQGMNVHTQWRFGVGDYAEAMVIQSNGATAARNLEVVANRSPEFYAARIGS